MLAVSKTLTDMIATTLCFDRQHYSDAKFETTEDFSDMRERERERNSKEVEDSEAAEGGARSSDEDNNNYGSGMHVSPEQARPQDPLLRLHGGGGGGYGAAARRNQAEDPKAVMSRLQKANPGRKPNTARMQGQ